MRNFPGATWHKTQMFPDHKKTTSLKFLRKLKVESHRICSRSLVRRETASETSRNANGTNQGTNEDDSQSDLHPEAGILQSQTTHNCGPEDGHDMVKGATEQIRKCHDVVTGATERHNKVTGARERRDMLTAVQEENLCGHDTGGEL